MCREQFFCRVAARRMTASRRTSRESMRAMPFQVGHEVVRARPDSRLDLEPRRRSRRLAGWAGAAGSAELMTPGTRCTQLLERSARISSTAAMTRGTSSMDAMPRRTPARARLTRAAMTAVRLECDLNTHRVADQDRAIDSAHRRGRWRRRRRDLSIVIARVGSRRRGGSPVPADNVGWSSESIGLGPARK